MPFVVIKEPIEVDNRLHKLLTSRENLLEVVNAMVSARRECTDFDPSGSRGWRGWQMGTRRNREIHCPVDGWEADNSDQIASILNKKIGVRIFVSNTDDGTCVEDSRPKNRSKKGAATDRAAAESQASMFEFMDAPIITRLHSKFEDGTSICTYVLCVFHEGDEVRAELSCLLLTNNGFFEKFGDRIFIVGGDYGPKEPVKRKSSDEGDESDFDIPVVRKK